MRLRLPGDVVREAEYGTIDLAMGLVVFRWREAGAAGAAWTTVSVRLSPSSRGRRVSLVEEGFETAERKKAALELWSAPFDAWAAAAKAGAGAPASRSGK